VKEILPTEVGGLTVITNQPVESPLSTPQRRIVFSGVKELLLSDDSSVYACRFCGHVEDKLGRIRSHQTYDCLKNPKGKPGTSLRGVVPRASNPPRETVKPKVLKPAKPKPAKPVESLLNGHITEGDDLVAALEMVLGGTAREAELTAQRDAALAEAADWKRRFYEAEHTLGRVKERIKNLL